MKRTSLIVSLVSILLVVAVAAGFLVSGARPQLGLDLQGGISAALQPDPDAEQPEDLDAALDVAVNLIRQRVDSLGVAEPDIARQGDDTILVQLPGITDADRARQVIGQTAQLTFHPVQRFVLPGTPEYTATPPCLIPETDEDGEAVVGEDGEPVYVLNPERPSPTNPTEDGTRYVCGEVSDPDETPEPIDTGEDVPRLQDLIESETATETETPTGTEAPTETETPTEEATGDAMAVTAADATEPTEAPSPTETTTGTEAPTDAPTEAPTFDDGLPEDAPRPLKYVVGPVPTDEQAILDAEPAPTETPTDGATDEPTDENTVEDPGADLPGDPLTGDDITDASPTVGSGGWVVQLDLDEDGGEAFRMVTAELACERDAGGAGQLAIVLDDVVRSAPNMAQGVLCGQGIAGGSATITVGGPAEEPEQAQEEAQNLALVLEVGALPLTLTEATFDTVSPTLGAASLRNGLVAGLIGLVLVGLYLVGFYRALGLVAIGALTVFGVLVFGTITLMGEVGFALTLAGVAGIVVSLGITADSSILFFERIRDEVALGKTMRTATRRGFESAFRTNLAGNTVTLAAALILYFLAVGPVRGFAFTLGLATILDIIIMWAFTRPVVGLLAGSKRLTRRSVRVPEPASSAGATSSGGAA